MILNILILGITLSIDAVFVGLSYGIRGTKIPLKSQLIMCMFSFVLSAVSVTAGTALISVLPVFAEKLIGSVILFFIGISMILKVFKKEKPKKKIYKPEKIVSFLIKPFGITIEIIKNPTMIDKDRSGVIDLKESILLGIALSADAIGVGIASSLLGICNYFLPVSIACFQFLFLTAGVYLGKVFTNKIKLNEKYMLIISGIILIGFALYKFFI